MADFLVVRFTHGSGGKFLSSVIQASETVDHWSTVLQNHKRHEIFPRLVGHYFQRSFPADHSLALRSEPHSPYCTDLYSSSYPRGAEVELDQYWSRATAVNDVRFLNSRAHGRLVNLIFNRPELPRFCKRSPTITVTIESESEQQWVCQTLWQKHWIQNHRELIYAPDDPDYCHATRLADVLKYNNPSRYPVSEKDYLMDKFVLNNPTRPWYLDHQMFGQHDDALELDNVFIPLSSFFHRDYFIDHIKNIMIRFDLDPVCTDLLDRMRKIWTANQIPFHA